MANVPPVEDIELGLLLQGVRERYGLDLAGFAREPLRARVDEIVEVEALGSISGLTDRVLRDREWLSRLVGSLATGRGPDASLVAALREIVVPVVRTWPFVRVWYVGCGDGEGVWAIARLLSEEGVYERSRIFATDLLEDGLADARASGPEDLVSNVVFTRHVPGTDGRFNEFNLILCRDVLSAYDRRLRERVLVLLHESLARFGVLCLGGGESLRGSSVARGFEPLDARLGIFRRVR